MRFIILFILIFVAVGCSIHKSNRKNPEHAIRKIQVDSLPGTLEWIEISYEQSKPFNTNLLSVNHDNTLLSFEEYLVAMSKEMTYPLYLQKIKQAGTADYTIKNDGANGIIMSMQSETLNRSYSEMAKWLMPIKYGVVSKSFQNSDSILLHLAFKKK